MTTTATLNNLEKIRMIQTETIEHMHSLLRILALDSNTENIAQPRNTGEGAVPKSSFEMLELNFVKMTERISALERELKSSTNGSDKQQMAAERLEKNEIYRRLDVMLTNIINMTTRISVLEKELENNKTNTDNNSKYLCQQIRGQQVLTSYPGFSSDVLTKKEEPKAVEVVQEITLVIQEEEAKEEEAKEEEAKEEEAEEEEAEEKEAEAEEEKEEEEEEEEEEETEEELVTEEEEEEQTEEKAIEVKKEAKEEEEEELDVFEIEIDDVTYFATHEENGLLFEVTADGDIGKQIGVIKDGEAIFS